MTGYEEEWARIGQTNSHLWIESCICNFSALLQEKPTRALPQFCLPLAPDKWRAVSILAALDILGIFAGTHFRSGFCSQSPIWCEPAAFFWTTFSCTCDEAPTGVLLIFVMSKFAKVSWLLWRSFIGVAPDLKHCRILAWNIGDYTTPHREEGAVVFSCGILCTPRKETGVAVAFWR